MRTAGYHVVGCALALLLSPLASKSQTQTAAQTRTPAQTQTQAPSTTPKIGDFVLYAERSIRFGHRSHTEHGDVGVRTTLPPSDQGPAQLRLDEHAKCGPALSPSTSMESDTEVGPIWTNSLKRDKDSKIGPQGTFPAALMPPVPFAPASGTGQDIWVKDHDSRLLTPGTYGTVIIEDHGSLRLAAGTYTFTSIRMYEDSAILGERVNIANPPTVDVVASATALNVHIVNGLDMFERAKIEPHWDDAKAGDFTIYVAGSNPVTITTPEFGPATSRLTPTTVVSMAKWAKIHGLLTAPNGTIWMADESEVKGAFAAFDIVLGVHVEAEFESGFPESAPGQQGTQQLSGYFGVDPDPTIAPLVGPVPADTKVALSFGLSVQNPAGLKTFIQQISDPKSPNFRKHLTQAQFYSTYGASAADYGSLRNWANSAGFTTYATFPNNLLLGITGTAAQVEQALFINLDYRLRQDGTSFIAPARNPSLNLSVPILHITGLNDYVLPRAFNVNGTGGCPRTSCGGSYRATDLRNAYLGVGSSCQKLDGTGQVVGIVDYAVFQNSDISNYFALQNPKLTPATFPAIVATESGGSPAANSTAEATLDVEMVQAIAPNAKILFFQGTSELTGHLDDILHAMATSNPPLTVGSCSLGFGRSDNSQQALDEMAAQGVSFFTASGDFGDIGDPQGNLDMDNQTLVGGTFLNTNPLSGTFPSVTYPNPYYAQPPGETTWNLHIGTANQAFGLTGGGIMNGSNQNGNCYCWPHFLCCGSGVPLPSYQLGVDMSTNGGSTTWRNYPDVSMLATQAEIFFSGGATSNFSGTSFAAPIWAGFTALANQASQQNGAGLSGFLNTTLYDIGLTSGLPTDLYKVCFNDVQDGVSNANGWGSASGFKSVKGYDLATGWGSPTCGLIQQLSTLTPLTPNQPLDLIRFVISTGGDDLRDNHCCGCGGTGLTATVLLQDGSSFSVTLKPTGTNEKWDNNTTTSPMDFPILSGVTLTQSQGIKGITLTIHEDYSTGCGPDNWDMTALNVSLFNPPFNASTAVCQLALKGTSTLQDGSTGLTRFSNSPGSSGVGQTATYLVSSGSGCP